MTEWRSKGYVQDSDDDVSTSDNPADEAVDQENLSLQDDANHTHDEQIGDVPQNAEREQATLQTLTSAHEPRPARQPSPTRPQSPDFEDLDELQRDDDGPEELPTPRRRSLPSSPSPAASKDIFEVPSSQPDIAQPQNIATPVSSGHKAPTFSQHQRPISQASKRRTSPVVVIPSQPNTREQTPANRRTFRQRNPIQLHPYLLENEAYRKTLQQAGERPIHVAAQQRRQQQEPLDEGTQWQAEEDHIIRGRADTEGSSDALVSSPPLGPQSPRSAPDQESWEDAEDLPSLQDMLRRSVQDGVSRGIKRQKVSHIIKHGKTTVQSPSSQHSPRLSPSQEQSPLDAHIGSTGKLQKPRLRKFRLPQNIGPAALLTPGPSSDNDRQRPAPPLFDSEASGDERPLPAGDRRRSPSTTRDRSPSPSSSSSSSDSDTHVKQLTKRIKGVLPASWLRLDQQANRRKRLSQTRLPHPALPAAEGPQRGVAKRILHRSSLTPPVASRTMLETSDESADENRVEAPRVERAASSLNAGARAGSARHADIQDLEEDDWIDPMLPSKTRKHHSGKSSKRHVRLQDAFAQAKTSKQSPSGEARHNRARTYTRPTTSQRKTKPKQTRLSIIDAIEDVPRASVPDFMRVSARRVRERPDLGRHSPSKKQISYHNREDNELAGRRLADWQRGRLKTWQPVPSRKPRSIPSTRPPLQEQPDNQQTRLPSPVKLARGASVDSEQARLSSTGIDATLTKRFRSGDPRQTRLQAVPVPPPTSTSGGRPSAGRSLDGEEKRRRVGQQLKNALSSRPGQLEEFHEQHQVEHHQDAFHNILFDLDDDYSHRQEYQQRRANPLLERFLSPDHEPVARRSPSGQSPGAKPRQKRRPHQAIQINRSELRLDFEEHFPAEAQLSTPTEGSPQGSNDVLQGLQRYGGAYTTNFRVTELLLGTYFHSNTFIGSCELQDALNVTRRSFDEGQGGISVANDGRTRFWGAWSEEVASDIQHVFSGLDKDGKDQSAPKELRSVVKYVSGSLHFLDDPDRQHFVHRLNTMINTTLDQLHDRSDASCTFSLLATLAYQVQHIAGGHVVSSETRKDAARSFRRAAKMVADMVVRQPNMIQRCYQDISQAEVASYCLNSDAPAVEAFVVLTHLLQRAEIPGFSTTDGISAALLRLNPASFNRVDSFEQTWSTLFHVMPFQSFDEQGVVRKALGQTGYGNWSFVKVILIRLFDLYGKASTANGSTINAYMRANMSRCHALVCKWRWQNAEPILGCMFDFFAKRGFAYLPSEGSRGSPAFLEHLDADPALSVDPADRSFDIFLKLLASCLRTMRSEQPPKKMKNLIWRFIPNHGRRLAKEVDLREDDLDALRNQHNLLCVLYWASPAEARLDCSHPQKLIDIMLSHAEVVRINIRAWTNLVRYQLSVDDGKSSIEPFATWFDALIVDLITLHRMARTEAEASFSVNASRGVAVSSKIRESVIDRNERQVEGLLTMMLISMSSLLRNAKNALLAKALFENCSMSATLSLFDPKKPRLLQHVALALDSYQTYFGLCAPTVRCLSTNQNSEDSQDFGDWSDIEALTEAGGNGAQDGEGFDEAFAQMQQLVSNCFGADGFFDDLFLNRVVDAWAIACRTSIKIGRRHWTYFIDRQSYGSWFQLRETEQKRAYSTLFLAKVIAWDKLAYEENMSSIISAWMISLVERESTLKYQHVLTNALINTDPENPMLRNLPFSTSEALGEYNIDLAELRERRLSLISGLLASIRRSCECPFEQDSALLQKMRQEYSNLLRDTMSEMKRIYLETQQGTPLRGGYVSFVQRVVEFLQQETADIFPIDKFFTDSGAFPLPATDPTYVVGRLKSYRRTLSDARSQKKLALFLQTTCERAAADSQQAYLVEQLTRSVEGIWEAGDNVPSLRGLLLEVLFPCFLEQIFPTECGWMLALPILEATSRICVNLAYCYNQADRKVNTQLSRTLAALTKPMRTAVAQIAANQALLNHPHISSTLRAILATAISLLPLIDYHYRLTGIESEAASHLMYMHAFAFVLDRTSRSMPLPEDLDLNANAYQTPIHPPDVPVDLQHSHNVAELATFCSRELKDSLAKNWVRHETPTDVEYYLIRGRDRKEVVVDLATPEKEVEDLLGVVEEFGRVWGRMPGLRELDPWTRGWKME